MAFTWYAEHYGSYNRVYGELGAAVGFLTWVWLSIVILLLGAEIDCELERRDPRSPGARAPGTTTNREKKI
jgi:membrane protein